MSTEAQSQEPQQSSSTATVVRLRGLPWSATVEEILDFLKDVKVKDGTDGVHIKMQVDGRSSGEAFVELETLEDRDASLALNGQYIGKRFVEVYDSSYPIMEREIGQPGAGGKGCVVRLRGLPYGCTDDDIRSFMEGIPIEAVTIQISENSKQTGEAFVVLGNPDDTDRALEKHKERIGARYIEVFRSSYEDIVPVVSYGRRGGGGGGGGGGPYDRGAGPRNYPPSGGGGGGGPVDNRGYQPGPGAGVGGGTALHQVKLRGLPYSAREYEIKRFLSPCEPSDVEIVFDNLKRPAGEAIVTFGSLQEVEEALKKDKQYIEKRYIDVFPLNKGPKGAGGGGQGGSYRGGGGGGGGYGY